MYEATDSSESPDRQAAVRPAHWVQPDPVGDILAIAWRPGVAPPRQIRVRPEVRDRMLAELDPVGRALLEERGVIGAQAPLPLVVDPHLPTFPGFEIVRTRPFADAA